MRRTLPGGWTLFDRILMGESATFAANKLIAMLEDEKAQRDALKSRLLGQNQASIDMRDAGLPMLRENV